MGAPGILFRVEEKVHVVSADLCVQIMNLDLKNYEL